MITGNGQSLAERQWGTGFIPSQYQGVKLRSVGDPVLYVSDPAGFDQIAAGAVHRAISRN